MVQVLLTNEKFVKSLASIDDNLAGKYLHAALVEAQEIELREIVGDSRLAAIKGRIQDKEIEQVEIPEIYQELIEKCQYVIAYKAIASLCIQATYKIANVGVVTTSDDNVSNLAWGDLVRVKEYYTHKSDSFTKQLQNFLLQNKDSFPELRECDCAQIKAHLYTAATSGLWLGGIRARRLGNCCK